MQIKKEDLVGGVLIKTGRACNMVTIGFNNAGKELWLHIQSFFRILLDDKLVAVSSDIYVDDKGKKTVNNKLFDKQISKSESKILNSVVKKIISREKDLFLIFDNGLRIEIFHDTLEPKQEIYRIFESDNLDSHYVVENP
ncbi:MAG: hypothetical protein FWE16_05475 [Firmicutes bacterium]|nr:hypothetical protein [Bacillota bacterium]